MHALNGRIQADHEPAQPEKKERKHGEITFREGDKVMQTKNNYKLAWKKSRYNGMAEEGIGVFNGDLGTILMIDNVEQELEVLLMMSAQRL